MFRVAALGYAVALAAVKSHGYAHRGAAWAVIGIMAVWTVVTIAGYARWRRRWPLLAADLVVAAACLLSSPWILGPPGVTPTRPTVPTYWVAAAVLAWALAGGGRVGAVAALLIGACDIAVRGSISQVNVDNTVLLTLAGIAVGYGARLAADGQRQLQRATELQAATRERERLARGIHDSVLQVLTLVQRRGVDLGGEAAELGRLAGEQEVALRTLVGTAASGHSSTGAGRAAGPSRAVGAGRDASDSLVDLRAVLGRHASATVTLATPAEPVLLPAAAADEVAAAVAAALDNAARHCGPEVRVWLLVEEGDDAVTVTVRDDGPGIAPGRLEQAAADGRLGVAQSIRGRMRDLGGTVTITSGPGVGTELELRVPW